MSLTRRCLVGAAAAALAPPARALDLSGLPPVLGATERVVRHGPSGCAIGGFDPVAYFADGAPVPGLADHELVWGGVAWRFASQANRRAFEAAPQVYAPRLGGHDPAAAADGRIVDGAPTLFLVQGSRLYLFRGDDGRRRVLADPALIARAESRWRELAQGLVR